MTYLPTTTISSSNVAITGGSISGVNLTANQIINQGADISNVRVSNTSYIAHAVTDHMILVNNSLALTPYTVALLDSPPAGTMVMIKDAAGTASTAIPIQIVTQSGRAIDGYSSIQITTAYGCCELEYGGGAWRVQNMFAGYTVPGSANTSVPSLTVNAIKNVATATPFLVTGAVKNYQATAANKLPFSSITGAATPSTLPGDWFPYSDTSASDTSWTVMGFGFDATTGLPYVDVKLSGTSTGSNDQDLFFTGTPTGVFTPNASATMSVYMAVVGGSTTGIGSIDFNCNEQDPNPTYGYQTTYGSAITGLTGSLQRIVRTFSTAPIPSGSTSTSIQMQPYIQVNYSTGHAISVTFRIAGVQMESGATATNFVATPLSATPTLQYQDNGGAWNAMPGGASVTASTYSFTHPAMSSTSASNVVAVRDAVHGTIVSSNAFQSYTSGAISLIAGGMTLNNRALFGAVAAGAVVGQIAVPVSGGVFTGGIASSSSNFIVNTDYQLITTSALAAGSYSTTLTATMDSATNSPQTLAVTVTVTAESANGTMLTSPAGVIVGSSTPGSSGSQDVWALVPGTGGVSNYQLTLNGILQNASAGVKMAYYANHTFFQYGNGAWYSFNGSVTSGQAGFNGPVASPIPVIALGAVTFLPDQSVSIPITTTVSGVTVTPSSYSLLPPTVDSAKFSISGTNLITTALPNSSSFLINITANY